jgi:glutamine synthetase
VNDAVLKVVKESFKETSAVRFEGNNYSQEWVDEAAKRGLLNLRRTPEALAQLTTKSSRAVMTKLGILTKAELESRYHVKMERYIKDMLIETHTLGQIVDTMILPACYSYHGMLADAAANAKAAGISSIPQVAAANEVGALIEMLRERRAALAKVIETAEHKHEDVEACGKLLTGDGADAMGAVRETCDALELIVGDEYWPLPKYREILFPV